MLRIYCGPETSANKYALNIHFTTQETGQRPKLIESDVDFELTFCNLWARPPRHESTTPGFAVI